ncbi:MAG: glycosyltransferase family 2 protein [Candidatus Binataceae bacterium]
MSIVVPTHNTRDLTLACLRSITRTPTDALEVVVVDDASMDDTAARVRESFPATKIIRVDRATGFTAAANRGLRESSGELLFLLNSDTEIEPDTLSRFRQAFADDSCLGAAGAALHFADGRPQWSGGAEPSMLWMFALTTGATASLDKVPLYRRLHPLNPARRGPVDWVTGAAMVIRRSAWAEVGVLDEQFHFYCQDLDYCMRLHDAGWKVAALPEIKVLHHGGATISRSHGTVRTGYNPELLWRDLVHFTEKRYGPRQAVSIARAMRVGGRLRVLSRHFAAKFLSGQKRCRWDRDTAAFARALSALSEW